MEFVEVGKAASLDVTREIPLFMCEFGYAGGSGNPDAENGPGDEGLCAMWGSTAAPETA